MASRRIYSRAPIAEAVIDLRLAGSVAQLTSLEGLASALEGYPERSTRTPISDQLAHLERPSSTSDSTRAEAIVFSSADRHRTLQVSSNSFTFSQMAPYSTWEEFSGEARRLWDIYEAFATPLEVERIAVRFINHIPLPPEDVELSEYLRTYPEVSSDMPIGSVSGFFMQLQIPQEDIDAIAMINEALVHDSGSWEVPGHRILFDVDLYQEIDRAPVQEIWSRLEVLHVRKNEIFESAITDRTRERIA